MYYHKLMYINTFALRIIHESSPFFMRHRITDDACSPSKKYLYKIHLLSDQLGNSIQMFAMKFTFSLIAEQLIKENGVAVNHRGKTIVLLTRRV